mgnify:CR=1 FL=1
MRDTARGVVEVGRACKYAEFRFGVEVLAAGLRERSVLVRHFKQARIAQFLRITIGTPEQNQALLDALGQIR